jgi:hypothetical protein
VDHPEFRWVAFGGNVTVQGNVVTVIPRDSFRTRVYVASLGLWLTLDAGTLESVEVNSSTGVVRVGLAGATEASPEALLRIEQPARVSGVGTYHPVSSLKPERGGNVVPLHQETTWVELNTGR